MTEVLCPDLRRAVHFVPGANEKMLQKALALPADSFVLTSKTRSLQRIRILPVRPLLNGSRLSILADKSEWCG